MRLKNHVERAAIRSELDPVGRVDVDHLNLPLEPFFLRQTRHDLKRVPQDHPVGPLLIVLVELDVVGEFEVVEVVVEAGEQAAVVGLDGFPGAQGVDDDAGFDDFLDVDRDDVHFKRLGVLLVRSSAHL